MSARNDLIESLQTIQSELDSAIFSADEVNLDEEQTADLTSELDEAQWYVASALRILRNEE